MGNLTTEKDFEIFKSQCIRELERFGIKDWHIQIVWEEEESGEGARAECSFSDDSRVAVLRLTKDWGQDEITEEQLRLSAFHEVLELLLAPAYEAACSPHHSLVQKRRLIAREHHLVIRTLENVLGYT